MIMTMVMMMFVGWEHSQVNDDVWHRSLKQFINISELTNESRFLGWRQQNKNCFVSAFKSALLSFICCMLAPWKERRSVEVLFRVRNTYPSNGQPLNWTSHKMFCCAPSTIRFVWLETKVYIIVNVLSKCATSCFRYLLEKRLRRLWVYWSLIRGLRHSSSVVDA